MPFGTIVFIVGLAFLALSILAAAKEILGGGPQKDAALERIDVTELIKELGKLKMWLALAILGSFLTLIGVYLSEGNAIRNLLGQPDAACPQQPSEPPAR